RAELTADWHPSKSWRLRGGWTELRAHSEPQPGTGDRGTRDSIARDPNHELSLRSSIDVSSRWECDAAVRYVGPIVTRSAPGYTEADLRIGWKPGPAADISLLG